MSVSLGTVRDNLLRMKEASEQLNNNWETLTPKERNRLWWTLHKAKAHLQGHFDKELDYDIKKPDFKGKPGTRN